MPSRRALHHPLPALATGALTLAIARPVLAQPGLTQPGPVQQPGPASGGVPGEPIAAPTAAVISPAPEVGPVPTLRDPGVARTLSLLGAAIPVGMVAVGLASDDSSAESLVTLGLLGTMVGPLAGHWYAGKIATKGLAMRLAGTAAVLVGGVMLVGCAFESECNSEALGTGLLIGGAAVSVGGMLHDVATADDSARAYNLAHASRSPRLTLAPRLGPDGHGGMQAGLTLAGGL